MLISMFPIVEMCCELNLMGSEELGRTCCVSLFRAEDPQEKITCSKLEAAAFLQDLRSDLEKLLEESMAVLGGVCDAEIHR